MKITVMAPSGTIKKYEGIRALSVGGADKELILLANFTEDKDIVRFEPDQWVSFKGERELYQEQMGKTLNAAK